MQWEPILSRFRIPSGRRNRYLLAGALALVGLFGLALFSNYYQEHQEALVEKRNRTQVLDNGQRIVFAADSPSLKLIQVAPVSKGSTVVNVLAPARVVASVGTKQKGQDPAILFESPEMTSIYSQYRQSRSAYERASKNHRRVKDMYVNQAATSRDLTDAETELQTARASKTENEGKLRGMGFDPEVLDKGPTAVAWLIADVPETQLQEVQKDEVVKVLLSSFPDKEFTGRAEAIGDVVDPITRTVKVRVSLPNEDSHILPGMFGRCDFGAPQSSVIVIPLSAVVTVEEQTYVFLAKSPHEFERRPVVIAASNASQGIVLKGVAEGESVAVSGAMLLKGLSFGY